VFGILSPGSLVRIRDVPGEEAPSGGDAVRAAVRDGFLSVTDNRVSILASVGQLAGEVDAATARTDLDTATADAGSPSAAEESTEVKYARARLRAAGEQA
jgi:F-type H+-transporting ATPase subunit epsilon